MRYLLFAGTAYYPAGGMDDFMGDYASVDEAKAVIGGICAGLSVSGDYPGIAELWAQIASSDDNGLKMIARFEGSKWIDDDVTPTLQSQADSDTSVSGISSTIGDYLNPERIAERKRQSEEWAKEDAKKKLIEGLWDKLMTAIAQEDSVSVLSLTSQLRKLGATKDYE